MSLRSFCKAMILPLMKKIQSSEEKMSRKKSRARLLKKLTEHFGHELPSVSVVHTEEMQKVHREVIDFVKKIDHAHQEAEKSTLKFG